MSTDSMTLAAPREERLPDGRQGDGRLAVRPVLPHPAGFGNLPPFPANAILDETRPKTRGPLLLGIFVMVVFCGGFTAWSVFAPLAEAAIAPGVIKVEGSRRTIQHLEGGIIREILVRDGTHVEAGQPLIRLDEIAADSSLETARAQRWLLLAQQARLEAEIGQRDRVSFPAELLASTDPRAQEAVIGQRTLSEARVTNIRSQAQVLLAQIAQQEAIIVGVRGQLAATRRQLVLIRQEEQMRRGLTQQGLGRLPELLAVQRTAAGLEGTLEDQTGQIDRAQATIDQNRRQIQQQTDQRLQEASIEIGEVRGRLAETEERLRAAQDIRVRREILAPEAGTIVNLKVFTIGAVARPGEPLMDLVPEHDRMIAEVNIQPTDIDVVYPGLRADVRLPAFRQRIVPFLRGQVTWVAADVTVNEQARASYYKAYILIDQDQLASLPGVFLTPGMPVEGHVKIGERSFFRFITQPLRDSFHRAFREQ